MVPSEAKRNAMWLRKLHRYLRNGRAFIAVGTLHLYGKKGLLNQLKRQGYKITRLPKGI